MKSKDLRRIFEMIVESKKFGGKQVLVSNDLLTDLVATFALDEVNNGNHAHDSEEHKEFSEILTKASRLDVEYRKMNGTWLHG
jgi:hypothetical protein